MKYKSQKVAYWFFGLCMLLFALQIIYGFIMGFARIGMDGLHDFIPFNTARAVHTNLLVVWLLTGFMGAAYYFHITGVVLLIIVVMAIACYAMTLATVMWVIISEIFPNRIRGVAMSVCTFALWAACFILTYTFPMLNSGLGAAGTFWLYGLICLSGGIFVVFRLPETKGKSLEEIEKELVK